MVDGQSGSTADTRDQPTLFYFELHSWPYNGCVVNHNNFGGGGGGGGAN